MGCVSPGCCSACCDCTVIEPQLLHLKVFALGSTVVSAVCFLRSLFSPHCSRLRFSRVRMHVPIAVIQLLWSAAWVCWIDAACLHVTFANFLNRRIGLPAGLVPVEKLPTLSVLRNPAILHSSDMIKPALAPLGQQSKQARHSCFR